MSIYLTCSYLLITWLAIIRYLTFSFTLACPHCSIELKPPVPSLSLGCFDQKSKFQVEDLPPSYSLWICSLVPPPTMSRYLKWDLRKKTSHPYSQLPEIADCPMVCFYSRAQSCQLIPHYFFSQKSYYSVGPSEGGHSMPRKIAQSLSLTTYCKWLVGWLDFIWKPSPQGWSFDVAPLAWDS